MRKGKLWPPSDIKIPEFFFKFELDVHDYVDEIYASANFHFNPFSGASPQIGEILRFCDFFLVLFFSRVRAYRTRGWIFTVYGSYDVFSPKDGPFGDCDNIGIHLGVISPKLPKRAWKAISKRFADSALLDVFAIYSGITRCCSKLFKIICKHNLHQSHKHTGELSEWFDQIAE